MKSMKKTRSSAPGKLMLFGEHAVVYGHPCIVTAVDQRINAEVELIGGDEVEVIAPSIKFSVAINKIDILQAPKEVKFVLAAVRIFAKKHGINKGLKITTISAFASSFGFGSSSAVTVAVIHGLHELFEIKVTKKELFEMCYQAVLDVQGVGSGFDLAAAIWGGTLLFVTGGKKIEPLAIENLPISVIFTGVKADTVTLVKQVSELRDRHPKIVDGIFKQIGAVVLSAQVALANSDWNQLSELMNINQGLLESLGVSTPLIHRVSDEAKEVGATGIKLSGAGGGDCLVALGELKGQRKFDVLEIGLQAAGVRSEKYE